MKRRGFLASAASLLTFSAFEKRCMAEAGISSPTDLTPMPQGWAILDSDGEVIAVAPTEELAERMVVIWMYDYLTTTDGAWMFYNALESEFFDACENGEYEENDAGYSAFEAKRIEQFTQRGAAFIKDENEPSVRLSPTRPTYELMKEIVDLAVIHEDCEYSQFSVKKFTDFFVLTPGNDSVLSNGKPYKPQ